jgi:ABC-2 type transport system ATP-binding protein
MADSMPPPLVEARDLTKRYGDLVAVDRLSFRVGAGEVYGLLGPNGAGKTTTILMLLGLSEPTAGDARVHGFDPARDPLEVKRRVGYLPDSVGFYGRLTARENLAYTVDLNGIAPDEGAARIEQLLSWVGLTDSADRPTDAFSRGMLQRLGIADALVKDPSVLILDEPTASIDPAGVGEMLSLIRRLADERGLAVLLSSHLLSQVERLCDRVGIFSRGRLVAEGSVAELAERAGSPDGGLDEVYRRLTVAAEEEERGGRAA